MATIFNTTTNTIEEVTLLCDGSDMMNDIIANNDFEGRWMTEEDADFQMEAGDLDWWKEWARREQRITDMANEIGEEAIDGIAKLGQDYGYDMEVLQDKEEEYLGI